MMEKKLYIPISSQNFNNVFATASLSPALFYEKRTFGIKRFFKTNLTVDDRILLFSYPPDFEIIANIGVDVHKIWVEVDKDYFEKNNLELQTTQNPEIFAYLGTIYFNYADFTFLFETNTSKEKIISKSRAYSEPKFVNKYLALAKIGILTKKQTPKKYNIDANSLEKIVLKDDFLENDTFLNHYKGLLYGYFLRQFEQQKGIQSEVGKHKTTLLAHIQNMKSGMALAFNVKPEPFYKPKKSIFSSQNSEMNTEMYWLKTKKVIQEFESFYHIIVETKTSELSFSFKSLQNTSENFAITVYNELPKELKNTEIEYFLKEKYLNIISDLEKKYLAKLKKTTPFELLIKEVEHIYQTYLRVRGIVNDSILSDSEDRIEDILGEISNTIILEFEKKQPQTSIQPVYESFTIKEKYTLQINPNSETFAKFDAKELEKLSLILNFLIKNPKKISGEITKKDLANNLLTSLMEKYKKESGLTFSEKIAEETDEFRKCMAFLYLHLTSGKDFNIENYPSVVNRNFATFILKVNSFDELMLFISNKKILNPEIAIFFWCAYQGFADLSKTMTADLFDKAENDAHCQKIENYIWENYKAVFFHKEGKKPLEKETPNISLTAQEKPKKGEKSKGKGSKSNKEPNKKEKMPPTSQNLTVFDSIENSKKEKLLNPEQNLEDKKTE